MLDTGGKGLAVHLPDVGDGQNFIAVQADPKVVRSGARTDTRVCGVRTVF